jgi:hypothetical protein
MIAAIIVQDSRRLGLAELRRIGITAKSDTRIAIKGIRE